MHIYWKMSVSRKTMLSLNNVNLDSVLSFFCTEDTLSNQLVQLPMFSKTLNVFEELSRV